MSQKIFEIRFMADVDGVAYVEAASEDEALEEFLTDKFKYVTKALVDSDAGIDVLVYETI